MKKKTLLIALLVLLSGLAFASDEVSIVVSSDGPTKDEAIKMALRSAIEQTFGAFVSSNTTVLDDQLVNDEIVSLSSGNVKSYKILTEDILPNNRYFVTLQATICMNKLVSYINTHTSGSAVMVNMESFDMNVRMVEMNRIAEQKIVENVITQIELMDNLFDYSLELEDPVLRDGGPTYGVFYVIKGEIFAKCNKNTQIAVDLLMNTIKQINMSAKEIKQYEKMGLPVYRGYSSGYAGCAEDHFIGEPICLRNQYDNSFFSPYNTYGFQGRLDGRYLIISPQLFNNKMKEFQIGDNISAPSKLRVSIGEFSTYIKGTFGYNENIYFKRYSIKGVKKYGIGDNIAKSEINIVIPKEEAQKYNSFTIQPVSTKK